MTETERNHLGKTLWGIVNQSRGAMNTDDFCDYMPPFAPVSALPVGQLRGHCRSGVWCRLVVIEQHKQGLLQQLFPVMDEAAA